jgi:O-antigen/teichoic acid export membrane protein
MYKLLVGNGRNIEQKGFLWNMISSIINSGISFLLVIIVNWTVGSTAGGIFGYANPISLWMLTLGNFGMRNYQSTDVKEKYSFGTYLGSRIISSAAMIIVSIIYIVYGVIAKDHALEKALVTLFLCIMRISDAVEDVYDALYQKHGRLDVGGRMWTYRVVLYTIAFALILILTKNLAAATLGLTVVSTVSLFLFIPLVKELFESDKPDFSISPIVQLFKECLPLFLGAFLLVYISMAPRNAIDTQLDEISQNIYSILSMPCFVINLLIGFVIRPALVELSNKWHATDKSGFVKLCSKLLGYTVIITIFVVAAGYWVGVPILTIMTNVDLLPYRDVFAVLLLGGGVYAFAMVLQTILTTMRHQYALLIGFGAAAVSGFIISPVMVRNFGIHGAAYSYVIASMVMCIVFIAIAAAVLLKARKK